MSRDQQEYEAALKLRARGYSLNEIRLKLGISQSTASLWCRNVRLSSVAKERIRMVSERGAKKGARMMQEKRERAYKIIHERARNTLSHVPFNQHVHSLLCSIIYVCEGAKQLHSGLGFTNSSPDLVRLFLALLRRAFRIDEKKFRVCVHLHAYHDVQKQLQYWSKVTNIPLAQFMKPYQKKNTHRRMREGYQGCVSIRYYDTKVVRELDDLYKILVAKILGA